MNQQQKNNKETKYSDKLKDPRWQKVRLKVFERDEWTCQICFNKELQLKVHHKYYVQGKEPWDYPPDALVTLCEKCHAEEWENRPEAEHALLRALKEKGFFAADVQELVEGVQKMQFLQSHEVVAGAYGWALAKPEAQQWLLERYGEYLTQETRGQKTTVPNRLGDRGHSGLHDKL
jgi:hypothetical protein